MSTPRSRNFTADCQQRQVQPLLLCLSSGSIIAGKQAHEVDRKNAIAAAKMAAAIAFQAILLYLDELAICCHAARTQLSFGVAHRAARRYNFESNMVKIVKLFLRSGQQPGFDLDLLFSNQSSFIATRNMSHNF
ncbi:MAG TPA: hypothetical protein DCY88_01345 [Cyanobacteria bacterium UBA11372]|nr:hypothetical protein [Cyanobacteria bacterium UBA11372]